jgi:hypothetical protein
MPAKKPLIFALKFLAFYLLGIKETHPLNPPPLKREGESFLRRGAKPLLNTRWHRQMISLHNIYGENCGIMGV